MPERAPQKNLRLSDWLSDLIYPPSGHWINWASRAEPFTVGMIAIKPRDLTDLKIARPCRCASGTAFPMISGNG